MFLLSDLGFSVFKFVDDLFKVVQGKLEFCCYLCDTEYSYSLPQQVGCCPYSLNRESSSLSSFMFEIPPL